MCIHLRVCVLSLCMYISHLCGMLQSKAMNSSTICSWQHFLRKPKVVPPHDTVVYFTRWGSNVPMHPMYDQYHGVLLLLCTLLYRSPVCPHESARNCQHTVGMKNVLIIYTTKLMYIEYIPANTQLLLCWCAHLHIMSLSKLYQWSNACHSL